MAKKNKDIELVPVKKSQAKFINIDCACGNNIEVNIEDCYFSGTEHECELCGSHGSVSFSYTCPLCGCNDDITLREW